MGTSVGRATLIMRARRGPKNRGNGFKLRGGGRLTRACSISHVSVYSMSCPLESINFILKSECNRAVITRKYSRKPGPSEVSGIPPKLKLL